MEILTPFRLTTTTTFHFSSSSSSSPKPLRIQTSSSSSLQLLKFNHLITSSSSSSSVTINPPSSSSTTTTLSTHYSNTDSWEHILTTLLHNTNKQELVSKEKKDRRDYHQIASLATKLGLHSRLYAKAVVVSKLPLPNYRFDLDDKRPQREVVLSHGLHTRVDDHLGAYISQKTKTKSKDGSQDNVFPTAGFKEDNVTNSGPFKQKESFPKDKGVSDDALWQRSMQLKLEQQAWQKSLEGQKMNEFRRSLPAYKEKDAILHSISKNQVVIISGETGCGKTTQVPQFILESEISSIRGATCNIICTQPRRISAMSVSERVATERGEKLGENVGYKVRLEGIKGKNTRLLFCTSGILLRRLLVDKDLTGVTHVIIDEVHERGIDEDFLLTIMKELLISRPELRLVLMSATINANIFSSYFDGAPMIQIPGVTHPVRTYFLENILESTRYKLTADNQIDDYGQVWKLNKQAPNKRKSQIASVVEEALVSADYSEYSQQTQDSLLCWNPDCINFNLVEYLLCNICKNETPGAIIVFMTGWDDISALKGKLQAHSVLGDPNRVLLLTCHGSMSNSEQRLIFEKVASGVRKIVLATNIAETSITIDDLVFVIDCGKAKEASYDALNNTPCLLPSWISKVSVKQRRGRSGRAQPGECYHLYPKCVYDAFMDYQLPKILRTPLQSLCLQVKSLNLGTSISEFLSRALQSPESLAVQNAIEYLRLIGALDENENLTILGGYLAMLPMEPKHGKMLVMGAVLNCLDPILTIVAGLNVRDPFLAPMEMKELAEAARAHFSHGFSDHLSLVRVYNGWKVAEQKRLGYKYCRKNFLSPQSMIAIDSFRREFQSVLKSINIIDDKASTYNTYSYDENIVRAVICSGLYPGVCSVVNKENSLSLKTMEDGQVFLNSKSANALDSKIPYPWLVFNKKVKVNSVYLQDSTAVSDSMLLLFGGSISSGDVGGHLKMLGGYLEFFMEPEVAIMYLTIKQELDDLFQRKLMDPKMKLQAHHKLLSAIQLLLSGDQCSGRFVYNHQVIRSNSTIASPLLPLPPPLVSASESGPGGDNSKSQLQTLLARAGHNAPIYRTDLSNSQFIAVCDINGMQIKGSPCNNKKQAEKDAASKALDWLLGGNRMTSETIDIISMIIKKTNKNNN